MRKFKTAKTPVNLASYPKDSSPITLTLPNANSSESNPYDTQQGGSNMPYINAGQSFLNPL